VAEGEILFDAILVCRVDGGRAGEGAAAFGVLGLQKMPFAGARPQDFAAGRNLETFGHGLFRFNAFGTSHKSNPISSKRARNIRGLFSGSKGILGKIVKTLNPDLRPSGHGVKTEERSRLITALRSCQRADHSPSFWVNPKAWRKDCLILLSRSRFHPRLPQVIAKPKTNNSLSLFSRLNPSVSIPF